MYLLCNKLSKAPTSFWLYTEEEEEEKDDDDDDDD